MPIPLSVIVSVRAALSNATRILSSESLPYKALFDSASKRNLSDASDALEINSRSTISLLL